MSACAQVAEDDVRALLALELPTRLLTRAQGEPPGSEQVRVACAGDEASLRRAQAGTGRTLSLAGVPPGLQARVLALAIAELLRPEQQQVVPAPARTPVPAAPTPKAAQRERERYRLWAGVYGAALPVLALGAGLILRAELMPLLTWSSALSFAQGRTDIDRGALRVQDIALRTGPSLSLQRGAWNLSLGAAAKLSLLRLSGEAADRSATRARGFQAWLFVPTLFAGAVLALGRGAFVALELEAGHALRRVRADVVGGGARTLSALRASATLGAGLQW